MIRLKKIFPRIPVHEQPPVYFSDLPDVCADLEWFMQRYPLEISDFDRELLTKNSNQYREDMVESERILAPNYKPKKIELKLPARDYQEVIPVFQKINKRFLLGDQVGLGKTLSGILCMFNPGQLPAIVCVQAHLPKQWKEEIEKFTNLRVHIIMPRKVYNLPEADVYIIKYSNVGYWTDVFATKYFKFALFDEIQELRKSDTDKYKGAVVLSDNVEGFVGLSGTPIYNYPDEIWNIMNVIKPGAMGTKDDFSREWGISENGSRKVEDPQALGAYLRENFLFIRRTRKDVGRELPPVNTIVHTVDYDKATVDKELNLARTLATTVLTGTFTERGQAARELDIKMRQITGVSKAKYVAEYAKVLLDSGEPILLAGWHRSVYDIWLEELKDYKPLMYTGSETPKAKDEAKQKFINGESNLMIISLRSGVGLDGLQKRCRTVLVGELDWSPKVHEQLIGRADRDGSLGGVMAVYLVSEAGSDPVIINILGVKSSQSDGVVDPFTTVKEVYSDESRVKILAEYVLNKKQSQLK